MNDYVADRNLQESDMEIKHTSINLKLPRSGSGYILVKNLYLSCDPYMRIKTQLMDGIGHYFEPFKPGTVLFEFTYPCQLKFTSIILTCLTRNSACHLRFDETSKNYLD